MNRIFASLSVIMLLTVMTSGCLDWFEEEEEEPVLLVATNDRVKLDYTGYIGVESATGLYTLNTTGKKYDVGDVFHTTNSSISGSPKPWPIVLELRTIIPRAPFLVSRGAATRLRTPAMSRLSA